MYNKEPSRSEAVLHKCHNCMAGYLDGKKDCCMVKCSLYYWMPYRELEPNLEWTKYSSKSVGNKEKKEATEVQIARGKALAASRKK